MIIRSIQILYLYLINIANSMDGTMITMCVDADIQIFCLNISFLSYYNKGEETGFILSTWIFPLLSQSGSGISCIATSSTVVNVTMFNALMNAFRLQGY